jgi:hypothetical protein
MEIQTGQATGREGKVEIKIDGHSFWIEPAPISGADLRALPIPPIGADRQLFQIFAGTQADLMIADDQIVDLENGVEFFSSPLTITAGQGSAQGGLIEAFWSAHRRGQPTAGLVPN